MRYITNDTASPMYVAGRLIPPFDGRHFTEAELGIAPSAPATQKPDDASERREAMEKILEHSVKDIVPMLQQLEKGDLDVLEALEQGGKTRKGVIEAIAEERVRRADEALEAEEAARHAEALEEARKVLLAARVAQENLSPTATEEERQAAQAAVDEAQAKVDALTPEEDEE